MKTAHERFGGLDVLVNNAANFLLKGILDTTDEEWDRLMRSNVRGVFVHSRAALPSLLDSRGTMVNVASVSGMVGTAGQAAYCTTKGAVVQLTRQLAVEFGPRGVRVNAVGPGAIDTEFVARSLGLEPGDRSSSTAPRCASAAWPGPARRWTSCANPRVAIHGPTADPPDEPKEWVGEAKLAGRAVAVANDDPDDDSPGSGSMSTRWC